MNAQEAGLQLSDPQKTLQDVLKQQSLDMNLTNSEKRFSII